MAPSRRRFLEVLLAGAKVTAGIAILNAMGGCATLQLARDRLAGPELQLIHFLERRYHVQFFVDSSVDQRLLP